MYIRFRLTDWDVMRHRVPNQIHPLRYNAQYLLGCFFLRLSCPVFANHGTRLARLQVGHLSDRLSIFVVLEDLFDDIHFFRLCSHGLEGLVYPSR